MRQRRRGARRWRALVVTEMLSLAVVWLLARSSMLIGDEHDESDDERAAAQRRAARMRRRRFRVGPGEEADDRLAQ